MTKILPAFAAKATFEVCNDMVAWMLSEAIEWMPLTVKTYKEPKREIVRSDSDRLPDVFYYPIFGGSLTVTDGERDYTITRAALEVALDDLGINTPDYLYRAATNNDDFDAIVSLRYMEEILDFIMRTEAQQKKANGQTVKRTVKPGIVTPDSEQERIQNYSKFKKGKGQ